MWSKGGAAACREPAILRQGKWGLRRTFAGRHVATRQLRPVEGFALSLRAEDVLKQVEADLREAEVEEWGKVKTALTTIGGFPDEWEDISEEAFKVGLASGAVWVIAYLKRMGVQFK